MARITDLELKDVRCFRGEQSASVNRVSLLVGPNSSGKSTFLGCYNALAHLSNFQDFEGYDLDDRTNYFDLPPYCMGSFDTVCRSGRRSFEFGGKFENHVYSDMKFVFEKGKDENATDFGSQMNIIERQMKVGFSAEESERVELNVSRKSDKRGNRYLDFFGPNFNSRIRENDISYRQISSWMSRSVRRQSLSPFEIVQRESTEIDRKVKAEFVKTLNFFRNEFRFPVGSLVNVRSPSMSFDRRRAYADNPIPSHGELKKFLDTVGRNVDIWKGVSVVGPGKNGTYEIMVHMPDGRRNLIDVGYGVYSLLAIASMLFGMKGETAFLLQQPEVHLHPEAQARLAQWIAESKENGYLIETHSDHFLDRFRICVMRGDLRPDELSIIYFEPSDDGTVLHNISVDECGNLHDVPRGYRNFFMKEAEALLGFS